MKTSIILAAATFAALTGQALLSGHALAAEPLGEWLVNDGTARIGIQPCAAMRPPGSPPVAAPPAPPKTVPVAVASIGPLCGNIAWTKTAGGFDDKNPDVAKRTRPILGLPILIEMKPTKPNRWEGNVYNAENGKTYKSSISLKSDDVLRVEGCVLGFLCGGEDWTRHKEPARPVAPPPAPTTRTQAPPPAPAPATAARQPVPTPVPVAR